MMGDTRVTDVVARIGGDEFVLFLPDTDTEGASMGLAKLQSSIYERMDSRGWPVTASIGAVTYRSPPDTVGEIIQRADRRRPGSPRFQKDEAQPFETAALVDRGEDKHVRVLIPGGQRAIGRKLAEQV